MSETVFCGHRQHRCKACTCGLLNSVRRQNRKSKKICKLSYFMCTFMQYTYHHQIISLSGSSGFCSLYLWAATHCKTVRLALITTLWREAGTQSQCAQCQETNREGERRGEVLYCDGWSKVNKYMNWYASPFIRIQYLFILWELLTTRKCIIHNEIQGSCLH